MNFHMGQKVVCIASAFSGGFDDEINPTKGAVYTVRGFDLNRSGCRCPVGLWLVEIVNAPRRYRGCPVPEECSFSASSFRPVQTTDISIFTAMLKTKSREKVN